MVEEEQAKKKQVPLYKTNLFWRISLVILTSILVIGVSTITIILHADKKDNSDNDGDRGMRQEIEALVGAEKLESPDSPYVKALNWMIHQDPMTLVPGVDSNFVQRYIMAYFYYATTTNGPWHSCNPAVGNELEFCYRTSLRTIDEPDCLTIPVATRWLRSVHECQFAGVVCNDKMQVVGLEMNRQELSGGFPVGIVYLPFLESIEFAMGNLSGPLPKNIDALEHLVHVDISGNKLSGEVPIEWWQSRFVSMILGHNDLAGSIPAKIKDMKNIKMLHLDVNKLTGTIPKEIEELTSLKYLQLSDNVLKGSIPSEFGQLERLVDLWIYQNLLTGTLAPELGNMKRLGDFRVHQNSMLGGDIPESLYQIKSLWRLELSKCNFTGTISPMVGNFKHLINFVINDNSFTGTIPVELVPIRKDLDPRDPFDGSMGISNVQVQNNNFQGNMPQEFCDLRLLILVSDCALDPTTGEVEFQCDCCTECCDAAGICNPT